VRANAIIVQPNVMPLVLSRLHRWTMAKPSRSLTIDSRAHRTKSKLQTAPGDTEVTPNWINVVGPSRWRPCWESVLLLTTINAGYRCCCLPGLSSISVAIRHGFLARVAHSLKRTGPHRGRWCRGRSWNHDHQISRPSSCSRIQSRESAGLGAMETFRKPPCVLGVWRPSVPVRLD